LSIIAYTGLPGSGKSYSVVEHQIIPALQAGRKVVTNLPLRMEKVAERSFPGEVVELPLDVVIAEPHKILEYCTAGCLLIIDEAWKIFPQGMQANKVAPEYGKLLAEHRHMVDEKGNSAQIVLVVQDLANVAAFARRLVENTFVTTKLSFVGLSGSFRVDVFHGAQTGATPPVSQRLRMITGRYRKEVFELYKSHTLAVSSDQVGANEKGMDQRANIWKRPVFAVGAVAVPLLLWWSLHTLGRLGHEGFGGMHKPVSVSTGSSPAEASARSGAERGSAAGPGGPRGFEDDGVRVLLERSVTGHPELSVVYIATPQRVLEVAAAECRRVGVRLECLYRGRYYDGSGFVEAAPSGPVGAWSVSGGPGVQGGGASPPGPATQRDGRHGSS
jgi:zona occludens toxin (predicted ATPase)